MEKAAEQNKNRSASRPKAVEQQIKLTEGNVNGGAVFSQSGKTAAKRWRNKLAAVPITRQSTSITRPMPRSGR
jgi:t-SNARE complex subunit (syntaxin)